MSSDSAMYNLFVRGHAGSWNGDPWTVDRSRCISGTDDDIIVQRSRAEVKVKYDLIACESFLTADDLSELETALHIRGGERGRTHWAVKDVDLYRVLQDEKGISLPRPGSIAVTRDPPTDSAISVDLWKPAGAPEIVHVEFGFTQEGGSRPVEDAEAVRICLLRGAR